MLQKIFCTIILFFIFSGTMQAQVGFHLPANTIPVNIDYAEYFIDTDPGFGNGTSIPVTSSTDVTANNYSVNLSAVNPGVHRICFRTRDAKGVWSLANAETFFKLYPNANIPANPVANDITRIEYFVDTDPGFGQGISIPVTASDDVSVSNTSLDISALTPGVHHIYFRTQDADGGWSLTNVQIFFIANVAVQVPSNPAAANIVRMEYFLDSDPGFGNGNPVAVTPATDVSATDVAIDLTGLSNGVHRIYFRTQDANGSWSETNLHTFNILMANVVIPPNPVAGNITRFEYFFDTDPGFGNGTTVSVPSTTDLSNYTFTADLTGLKDDTVHTLYIRTYDNWSLTNTQSFILGHIVPLTWISFDARAVDNNVALAWITARELNTDHFDIERSADGLHFSTIGTVTSQNQSRQTDYTFADKHPLKGISYYRLKQVDVDGHFTYSIIISVKRSTQISVQILGNPVREYLHLEIDGTAGNAIPAWIADVSGRRHQTFTISDGSKQINIKGLPSGMYYLVYQWDNRAVSIPFDKQ